MILLGYHKEPRFRDYINFEMSKAMTEDDIKKLLEER